MTLTQVSATSPSLSLDPASGQVSVAAGTPAGTYTLVYEVCEILNPANCAQAAVTVNVTAATLAAIDDSGSVDGATGGTAGPSVLANDRLGDAPVDPAAVTLVQVSSTSPTVSLDPATGRVSVAQGTPAGSYTVVYRVCEVLNPSNCATASVTVVVTSASIVANPDSRSIGGLAGGPVVPSVLANDTLGGAPVDPAAVTLTQVSASGPSLSLDPSNGQVSGHAVASAAIHWRSPPSVAGSTGSHLRSSWRPRCAPLEPSRRSSPCWPRTKAFGSR